MRNHRFVSFGLLLLLGFSVHAQNATPAAQRRQEIDKSAQTTLDALLQTDANAKALYDRAVGYAVFNATKAGFFVSGGGGTGVAVDRGTGKRTYMRMGLGGIGLGIGAQRYALVVLFETQDHLKKFLAGGWDSSATAEAAAAKEGVAARASFMNGAAFYQITEKGLMAHADITGTKFWAVDDLN
ncbi:MAG: YSC84-related protein [Terriglobia bacterium]